MKKREKQSVAYDGPLVYVGRGAALVDVPARHLNADEARRYGGHALLLASGLYAVPVDGGPEAAAEPVGDLLAAEHETSAAPENAAPQEEMSDGDGY